MLVYRRGTDRERLKNKVKPEYSLLGQDPLTPLVIAEIILFVTIALSTLIIHSDQVNIYGISYLGIQAQTLPILAVGFMSAGTLLFISAARLPRTPPWKLVGNTLRIVAVGTVFLLLTPYTLDTFFNWTHMTIGAVVFATEMYSGSVLYFRTVRDHYSRYALIVQFIGGVLAMFSLPDNMLTFMLEGEVIFQIGFSLLLNHAIKKRHEFDLE